MEKLSASLSKNTFYAAKKATKNSQSEFARAPRGKRRRGESAGTGVAATRGRLSSATGRVPPRCRLGSAPGNVRGDDAGRTARVRLIAARPPPAPSNIARHRTRPCLPTPTGRARQRGPRGRGGRGDRGRGRGRGPNEKEEGALLPLRVRRRRRPPRHRARAEPRGRDRARRAPDAAVRARGPVRDAGGPHVGRDLQDREGHRGGRLLARAARETQGRVPRGVDLSMTFLPSRCVARSPGRLAAPPRGATWIFRGDESRRRGWGWGSSGRIAAPPRRGYSVETGRGDAAAGTWIVRGRSYERPFLLVAAASD